MAWTVDNTKGNSILLYTVKNTTWINFTISQFNVLIKKQQSPLKKSIPTKEAKERIPLSVSHPSALSIQRHAQRRCRPFRLSTYIKALNRKKKWNGLSVCGEDLWYYLPWELKGEPKLDLHTGSNVAELYSAHSVVNSAF